MKVHEEVFLSLVRNSLWETQVEVPVGFKDWGLVMRLAKIQALQGSVAKALLDNPSVMATMKPGAELKLSDQVLSNVLMHSIANSSLQTLVPALSGAGISCVLLKGQGLAANYPQPEMRECGDIDLYVGEKDYRGSYEVLRDLVEEIDEQKVLDGNGKHYHAWVSGISIEVHKFSEVIPYKALDKLYQKYASEGLSDNLVELKFGDGKVMTPADNFNAFYVFSHLWQHYISIGVGLRQVCDWTMFLHKRGGNVDREYLRQVLTEMNMMRPWKVFGCIAVDILGLAEDEFPFYDAKYRNNALKVLKHIIHEGDLGRETEFIRVADRGYLKEKLVSLKFYLKRFIALVTVFPAHALRHVCRSVCNGLRGTVRDMTTSLRSMI